MYHHLFNLVKQGLFFKTFLKQVVNPYKRYPLYTHRVCKIYLGKRRNEVNLN